VEQERKSRSCLGCGCQIAAVLMLLVVLAAAWVFAVQAGVLERLGLRESSAEELLSGAPDRQAAAAVVEELHQAEINTRGMSIQVFPMKGTNGKLAVAVVDRSQGFVLGRAGTRGRRWSGFRTCSRETRSIASESREWLSSPEMRRADSWQR